MVLNGYLAKYGPVLLQTAEVSANKEATALNE